MVTEASFMAGADTALAHHGIPHAACSLITVLTPA